ncbi:MAG TPA: helix-turn-helix transcriptional regulator [Novosphingobium sp.]|nr:helix-turn-helix transcriptional regulator [Novosphingobium sp.]HQA16812.1 helix-turn-helix transcriptional regulator [Novosphingobium sp.]
MEITLINSCCTDLGSCLIGYIGGEIVDRGQMVRRVIPARPNCFVQIVLEGRQWLYDLESRERIEAPQAGLFGPLTHYRYDLETEGRLRTFSARLQPAAAGGLFKVDPIALVDSFVPVSLPDGLLEELRAAPDWAAMAGPVDSWLRTLGGGGVTCTDPVAREATRLRLERGTVPIQDLADSSGLSLRHFQRRFRQLTGLNPKRYARICRIGHAVHRKELDPDLPWTTLAYEAGYADQSHFIRDFKALTGCLPSEFLRGQTPILRYPKWDE